MGVLVGAGGVAVVAGAWVGGSVGVAVGAGGAAVWQAASSPVSNRMMLTDKITRIGVCEAMSDPFVIPAGRLDGLIVDSVVRFVN